MVTAARSRAAGGTDADARRPLEQDAGERRVILLDLVVLYGQVHRDRVGRAHSARVAGRPEGRSPDGIGAIGEALRPRDWRRFYRDDILTSLERLEGARWKHRGD